MFYTLLTMLKGQKLGLPLALLVGFLGGFFLPSLLTTTLADTILQDQRESSSTYTYVSPLLSCPEVEINHLDNSAINELEEVLQQEISARKNNGDIVNAGLYFRQLRGGPWRGINHELEFFPRSLLKVPLVMSLYKEAEKKPSLLLAQLKYEPSGEAAPQHFGHNGLVPGQTYSIEDLVRAALIDSDNGAAVMLSNVVGMDAVQESYAKLGIEIPVIKGEYTTTVRNYASFFRILYNATYLSPEASEHILKTLSEASFTSGLVAGVPRSIAVAHKFGEQGRADLNLVQLHDCGIVYHPKRPYLLCVMTAGRDFDQLAKSIQKLSEIVYDFIEKG